MKKYYLALLLLILFIPSRSVAVKPILAPIMPAQPTTDQLRAYVVSQAEQKGINPDLAVCLITHESEWVTNKIGPEVKGKSQGLWQIYNIAWPTITQSEAFNYIWSTSWALTQIRNGHVSYWSTYSSKPFYCRNIPVFI